MRGRLLWSTLPINTISGVARVGGGAALISLAVICLSQRSLIYPAPREGFPIDKYGGAAAQLIRWDISKEEGRPTGSGDELHGAFFPPEDDGAPVLVFWHGNADQIGWGASWLGSQMHRLKLGFFAAEYPGYGYSSSAGAYASETSLFWAASETLKRIESSLGIRKDRIVLVGQSLGCAVALEMAARGHGSRVCLISPFTSIVDMASEVIPFLPRQAAAAMVWDPFDNEAAALRFAGRVPTLLIHGTRDEVVPFTQGKALSSQIHGAEFVPVEGAGHNDILDSVIETVSQFARTDTVQ